MAGFSDLRAKVDAMRRAVANLTPMFAVLEQEDGETPEDFDARVARWTAAAIESTGRAPRTFVIRDGESRDSSAEPASSPSELFRGKPSKRVSDPTVAGGSDGEA